MELILLRPHSLLSGTVEVWHKPLAYPHKSVKKLFFFAKKKMQKFFLHKIDNSNIGSGNDVSLGCGYIFYWPITYF